MLVSVVKYSDGEGVFLAGVKLNIIVVSVFPYALCFYIAETILPMPVKHVTRNFITCFEYGVVRNGNGLIHQQRSRNGGYLDRILHIQRSGSIRDFIFDVSAR